MRASGSIISSTASAESLARARGGIEFVTDASESGRLVASEAFRMACTSLSVPRSSSLLQLTPSGQRTITSTPMTPPNSSSTAISACEEAACRGSESTTRLSASTCIPIAVRSSVPTRPTAAIGRA